MILQYGLDKVVPHNKMNTINKEEAKERAKLLLPNYNSFAHTNNNNLEVLITNYIVEGEKHLEQSDIDNIVGQLQEQQIDKLETKTTTIEEVVDEWDEIDKAWG